MVSGLAIWANPILANPLLASPFLCCCWNCYVLLCVVVCCCVLLVWTLLTQRRTSLPSPSQVPPATPEPPAPDRPKFRAFFLPFSRSHFRSFFSLSLGVFSLNFWWCFRRPGPSSVHVWALRLSCEFPARLGLPPHKISNIALHLSECH